MKYISGSTLLAQTSEDIRSVPRVPWRELPATDLLMYDSGVSDFFFEFDPPEEIDRFLQHAHLGCRAKGSLLACREDLYEIAHSLRLTVDQPPELILPVDGGDLPAPLRFVPHQPAFEGIARDGRWRGRITCCSCGIAGCFAQYAWVEQGVCLFVFTINGATLAEVECLPFRVAGVGGRG
jgi:hypothetical protein